MDGLQVFITGDYWHKDFQSVLSSLHATTTMVPLENIAEFDFSSNRFSLAIFAESRRSQINQQQVENVRSQIPNTPLVALKGSLCEGELRSGTPLIGVNSVYWHQWQGRFELFKEQMLDQGLSDWHLPATATTADLLQRRNSTGLANRNHLNIGVSAWQQEQFEYLNDALGSFGWSANWIERTRWDAELVQQLQAICVEANSLTDDLKHRIQWLRNSFPDTPLVLVLNFPRKNELAEAVGLGVSQIVSKPFELVDLKHSILQAVDRGRFVDSGDGHSGDGESWTHP